MNRSVRSEHVLYLNANRYKKDAGHLFAYGVKMGALDLTGMRFKRLVAIERVENSHRGTRWKCLCDCGTTTIVATRELRTGDTKSCGCWDKEKAAERRRTHGASYTPEYTVWINMWNRCEDPKNNMFHRYGGRGIKVDEQWRDFSAFIGDMGTRPSRKHTLERRDNNKGYGPANCSWATYTEQSRNKSNNRIVTYKGQTVALPDAVALSTAGADYRCVKSRLQRGWDVQRALDTPPHPNYQAEQLRRRKKLIILSEAAPSALKP